jgi:hypothetical protein
LGHNITNNSKSAKLHRELNSLENYWEPVMTRTILISVTAFFVIAGAWTVNLVTYHPVDQGLNPLTPITLSGAGISRQPPV